MKNAKWISDETERKEADFRGLLAMHVNICKGIVPRNGGAPYLYADLYAGRGHLEYKGRRFDGSPLIAREILSGAGLPYEQVLYERDAMEAAFLIAALSERSSTLFEAAGGDGSPVCIEPCQDGFARWLKERGHQPSRYGLIYSDPISDEIQHELFNKAAALLPRVDLLSYVAATQYKRRRGGAALHGVEKPYLADHIAAVGKRHVLIREPLGRQQWTFVLWTNWTKFPEWERHGFYRLDSPRGKRVLERLDFSEREQHERANTPLFQLPRPDDAPYRGYREYLRHPRFLEIRAEVFRRAAGRCERCMDRAPTEPHHLRYPPWGTFDVPENMIAVCHGCHCEIHGKAS